jgi:hypothetical protein
MIVHSRVREVRRHDFKRPPAAYLEKLGFSGCIELQECRTELKTLSPFGPASIGVLPADREYRGTGGGIPAPLNRMNLRSGKLE